MEFTEFLTAVDKAWKPSDSDKCKFLDGNKISKPPREKLQLTEEDFDFEAPKEYLANDATLVFGHTHRLFPLPEHNQPRLLDNQLSNAQHLSGDKRLPRKTVGLSSERWFQM